MDSMVQQTLTAYADAFAFLGNTLLKPLRMTAHVGLEATFWPQFPDFDNEGVKAAACACAVWAQRCECDTTVDWVGEVSAEYTRLFVGPGEPAAAPWETMYGASGEVTCGFGQATFAMRAMLRAIGKQVDNDNNQYEDHMGIELLYLAERCRLATDAFAGEDGGCDTPYAVVVYVREHPLRWIAAFREAVAIAAPDGYYANVLCLTEALLEAFVSEVWA